VCLKYIPLRVKRLLKRNRYHDTNVHDLVAVPEDGTRDCGRLYCDFGHTPTQQRGRHQSIFSTQTHNSAILLIFGTFLPRNYIDRYWIFNRYHTLNDIGLAWETEDAISPVSSGVHLPYVTAPIVGSIFLILHNRQMTKCPTLN